MGRWDTGQLLGALEAAVIHGVHVSKSGQWARHEQRKAMGHRQSPAQLVACILSARFASPLCTAPLLHADRTSPVRHLAQTDQMTAYEQATGRKKVDDRAARTAVM